MAADVCSEIPSLISSPRISFSYDLNPIDSLPIQDYRNSSAPDFNFNFDFSFCNENRFSREIAPADELFSNGKILSVKIKVPNSDHKKIRTQNSEPNAPINECPNVNEETRKQRLKEFLCINFELEEEKTFSKIFRQFRRSTSLNVQRGKAMGLIRPLRFLSRSSSTGSALDPKQNVISNISSKQNSFKQSPVTFSRSSSSSSSAYYPYNLSKKPPLKKKHRAYSNGVRITPVLQISYSCMVFGTVSLFRLGSLFCNRKTKKKKK